MKKIILIATILGFASSFSPGGRTMAAESPVIGALEAVKANAQIQQAKADLLSLATGFQMSKLLAGAYPTVEQGRRIQVASAIGKVGMRPGAV
jgi:hypothetical protein